MKQEFTKQLPRWLAAISISMACAITGTATEVHTWTDEDGTVHFSDAPPDSGESETIDVEEVYMPGTSDAYPEASQAEDSAAEMLMGQDPDTPHSAAEQRREDIATARQERREAEEEKDRVCGLHRQRLTQMEPARRVFYTNEQGEQVRMDDNERMGLIEESKQFLAENCD